ncbi:alpha/beta hydrolase family esterase [Bifidobacterium psychraerophilum]|uniref:alpha/beta hydrolase family esterase n=1 Tax=Bifidobacterium psychraerophilum TaxID=218140 RepID=UPI0039E8908C
MYGRQAVLEGDDRVPLVLFMNGTGGDPQQQAIDSGWAAKAQSEDIVVVSPEYNDSATYSEVDYLTEVIAMAKRRYPIDETRVYALGFSNGGASAVALTSRHPELFAGIAAYGWQVDLDNPIEGYTMPFQIIQGSDEGTRTDTAGNPMVRDGTRESMRSLLLYNGMIDDDDASDFRETPYWGYKPDDMRTDTVDSVSWTVNSYHKTDYNNPFAQCILIENGIHEPHQAEGATVWALQVLAFEIDLVLIRNVCDPGESLCRDKPTTQQRVP